ncbi:hypothetical protein chiPu_0032531, partial [Chiloscyllium punctatum]|nr:hypothetical protein [Chiloscyllium punctatum]
YLDGLNAGLAEKAVEGGDLGARPAFGAVGEDHPLLGPRERDEEAGGRLHLVASKTPPGAVIKPDKDDAMVFEPLALVDRHERNGMQAFVGVEGLRPICGVGR